MKTVIITCLMLYAFIGNAQNLVPNPSFEDTNYCPNGFADIGSLKEWYSPNGGTPDYFNTCDLSNNVGVPNNLAGTQSAHSGNGYAGWIAAFDSTSLNVREYLQIKLTEPMEATKNYIVTAYISKADSSPVALKNFGILISEFPIGNATGTTILGNPQITYSTFLIDTLNWILLTDTITANGGENYLTIGYFKDNNGLDTANMDESVYFHQQSYYYIDDVSVLQDSNAAIKEILNQKVKIHFQYTKLCISSELDYETEMVIYDYQGRIVESFKLFPNDLFELDFAAKPRGVYFLKELNYQLSFTRKIVKDF